MDRKRKLAILGGLGAAAGVRMAGYVVEYFQHRLEATKDSDFPEFVLYNLPVEGMSEKGIEDAPRVEAQLVTAVKKLNVLECDYLLVACNTVHCFLPLLAEAFNGDVINIVAHAARNIKGLKAVGIMCSETTKRLGLYERAFRAQGTEVISTNDEEQESLNQAIAAVISGEVPPPIDRVVANLKKRGAEMVIVGCTELPLALPTSLDWVDAGRMAAYHAASLLK